MTSSLLNHNQNTLTLPLSPNNTFPIIYTYIVFESYEHSNKRNPPPPRHYYHSPTLLYHILLQQNKKYSPVVVLKWKQKKALEVYLL